MALSLSSGHTAEYLTAQVAQGRESYYLDATTAGEPPGRWWGVGAESLGLTGLVDNDVMTALYTDFLDPTDERFGDPATRAQARRLGRAPGRYRTVEDVVAERLAAEPGALPERVREIEAEARRQTRQPVMFHDATFSPVKSFTVLHTALRRAELDAQRAGDEASRELWAGLVADAEAALWAGNAAMLSVLCERGGYSRTGRHGAGAGRWVDAHEWTVASFHQSDSRDHDPQQHIHNAILNRVRCADGQWRTLDGAALYEWKQAAGAIGERVMEEELSRRLGVRWELRPDGAGREIVDIDQAARDLFSERSAHIGKRLGALVDAFEEKFGRAPTALEVTRLRQQATLGTRRAKEHAGESREEQLDRWDRELRAEVAGGLHRVADTIRRRAAAGPVAAEKFSPAGVIAEAVAACQATRAAFSRSELERHIVMRLPHLGGLDAEQVREVVTGLADQAVAHLVEVTGAQSAAVVPEALRLADGRSAYSAPRGTLYATREHVVAEQALRRAAVERGRMAVSVREAGRWLAESGSGLGVDQAAAVRGLLTSGAAVSVLVGPAGTGKSYTLGRAAQAWEELTGGRVIGLATAQIAADVLTADGVQAMNTARWLATQRRLEAGRPMRTDPPWRLTSRDVIVLDESSMADTDAVAEVRRRVDAVGARLVLAGDPAQLGAVGAGGAMDMLTGTSGAETYHLSEVRRFHAEWERAASLRLRDGDAAVLSEYDRRGRLRDAGTIEQAMHAAARAYVADTVAGRTAVVVTPTNAQAARLSGMIRDRLVGLGLVAEGGVTLGRDQNPAGIGDVVQTRRNDRRLNVVNRARYRVTGLLPDGGLDVVGDDGQTRHLPASYVAEDLTLAYAGTVHAAEGLTVDTGHQIVTGQTSREAAYVGLTRGRADNIAWVVTHAETPGETTGETHARDRRDALAVLADILDQEDVTERAALVQAAEDARQAGSLHTIAARIEDGVRHVTRQRLDRHLDELAAAGVLSEEHRRALAADQGAEQLARLLRAVEQAGHDHQQALRDAITERDLSNARSVAQVLHHRITATYGQALAPATDPAGAVPADAGEDWVEYLTALSEAAADRRRDLGSEVVADPPTWALDTLGPVPGDPLDRVEWETRAGAVAAYREATGWADEVEPIGPAPGLSSTERRMSWHEAWAALGRPETTAEEHDLSEGALRNRVLAWQREQTWAPADAYDQQRATHQAIRDAQVADALAADDDQADARVAHMAMLSEAAAALEQAADARAEWLVETAVTRDLAERAEAELSARGCPIGGEPDRVTAEEWLAEHRTAIAAEDPHREIHEVDLLTPERGDHTARDLTEQAAAHRSEAQVEPPAPTTQEATTLPAGVPSQAEMTAAVASAQLAAAEISRRRATEAAHHQDEVTRQAEEQETHRTAHYDAKKRDRSHEAVMER